MKFEMRKSRLMEAKYPARETTFDSVQRPDVACARRRPGDDLRRGPVRDAASGSIRTSSRKLGITVARSSTPLQKQNKVNPAGQIGGEPVPQGQEFTYTVRAQGRLVTRAVRGHRRARQRRRIDGPHARRRAHRARRPDLRQIGRLNGKPAAIVAIYQLPGCNAIDTMRRGDALMEEAKKRFPRRSRLRRLARHDRWP